MAFDACMMRAVLSELQHGFPDAKIEKVLQPQNDEIDLVIHSGKNSARLVFNVSANAPRLQLSSVAKENPVKAPMFCMLLRKHLAGARIVGVSQIGFDRIADLTLSAYDEMGYKTNRHIICEIMGKYANLILLDGDYKIISALKVIDFSASTVRQVLPGLKYQIPAIQEKLSILEINRDLFFKACMSFDGEKTAEKFITSSYSGIATQIAHEIVFRSTGHIDVPLCNIDKDRFYSVFEDWQRLLIDQRYTPTIAIDKSGKPVDYSYMDLTYLEDTVVTKSYDSLKDLLDIYFAERDRIERIRQRAHDLITLINNARARTEKKLSIQREALIDSERAGEYKRKADLITSSIYMLKKGMTVFETVDYYDESMPTVTVELDGRLTPTQNAQRMYKLYNKAKKAKEILTEQIDIWEKELEYLDSVQAFLSSSECEDDLAEIRDELYRSGYASRMKGYKPPKQIKAKPHQFVTSGGYTLYVGRNNVQNDYLTFRMAEKDDLWFHTKGFPGSHVIMVTNGDEPSERDYTEAASVAAYYSQAEGDNIAVDYTRVKNIKKPQGAKPGFVIYKNNYTAFVGKMSGEELKNG